MKAPSRAKVASSFTAIKGAMIEETYTAFSAWDLGRTKQENLARAREDNVIGARSATWLRDVTKVLNRRFDPSGRDRPLVILAKRGLSIEEWKPLLLWHMTRDEFLVRDFLENWLFAAYNSGVFKVQNSDVEMYLRGIGDRGGTIEHAWSSQTTKRVAAGLLKISADFGLLRGSHAKEFASFHLPERSFIYILYAIRDELLSPSKVISSTHWHLFLMSPQDVERELLRLHQFKTIQYEVAGSLMQLSLQYPSAAAYAEKMVA